MFVQRLEGGRSLMSGWWGSEWSTESGEGDWECEKTEEGGMTRVRPHTLSLSL